MGIATIIGLLIALCIAGLELNGGCLGDSSMVPGYLVLMIIVLAAMAAIGVLNGDFIFQIR